MSWNKCPNCSTASNGKSAFCPNCGEPWIIVCPHCGLTHRFWEEYKYCPTRGAEFSKRISVGTKRE